MFRHLLLILALSCCQMLAAQAQPLREVNARLYSETIRVSYSPNLLTVPPPKANSHALAQHFQSLAKTNYAPLLNSLQQARKIFGLNDWMYYQLMRSVLDEAYQGKAPILKELAAWFLLSQSGFDTRLAYLEGEVFVYVYFEGAIFEAPVIEDRGRPFVNLTNVHSGGWPQRALYLLDFRPNPNGRAFSFKLEKLPLLRPQETEKEVRFSWQGETFVLKLKVDETVGLFMEEYPLLGEEHYLDVPLSESLATSLLPQLRSILRGKSDWEAAEILAAFTRSAFDYKEDKEHFGRSKPMVAEEVFMYPYSDCEDRSALFVSLARELLGLPMIVIAYPGHMTVGVALPQTKEGYVRYKGKPYYICDPTGPVNSTEIGQVPQGYEGQPFEIIKSYQ